MTWYVLKASKPGLWADAEDYNWTGSDFPYELLQEFGVKGEGVSVYEMDSEADPLLETLAAAFGFVDGKDQTFRNVMFRFADSTVVSTLNIDVAKTKARFEGFTIPELSAKHRDLKLNGEKVVKLARHMSGQIIKLYPPDEVGRLVAEHLIAKKLPTEGLDAARLKALHKTSHLQLI